MSPSDRKSDNQRRYLFDDPARVKLLVRLLVAACVVLFGLDLVLHRHTVHPWESLIGFYPLYGFVACVILVLLAKELRKLVMRRQDFYQQTDSLAPSDNQRLKEKMQRNQDSNDG